MVGIYGYGADIPRNRIKVEEIAKVWGTDAPSYRKGMMLEEKSVPSPDQDTITMSVEAGRRAVKRAGIDPADIGAVYVGSESHPYAVKPIYIVKTYISFTPAGVHYYRGVVKKCNTMMMADLYPTLRGSN